MKIEPITLTGRIVRLAPLELDHLHDLAEAGKDENIWDYMRYGIVNTPEKMRVMIDSLLALQQKGSDLPFTVIDLASGKAIGMTRYLNIEPANRALEIGGTWYQPEFQHTGVNTECKYLLLRHAFEDLDCLRVQFKADQRNLRSQQAILRIGALREGVLRNHVILPDGFVRSSVIFSILVEEWPQVKTHLENLLRRQA
jgi:RimJ/RimL family protein N-acetyltransferase